MGVYLTNDNINLHALNIIPQLTKIDNPISIWKLWNMTPYRCITIVKTFFISQLIYKLYLLPSVKVNAKELQNKLDNFVWGFKRHVVKKRILYASYKVGGLNMVNLEHFFNSLSLSWIFWLHQNIHWHKLVLNDSVDMYVVLEI